MSVRRCGGHREARQVGQAEIAFFGAIGDYIQLGETSVSSRGVLKVYADNEPPSIAEPILERAQLATLRRGFFRALSHRIGSGEWQPPLLVDHLRETPMRRAR